MNSFKLKILVGLLIAAIIYLINLYFHRVDKIVEDSLLMTNYNTAIVKRLSNDNNKSLIDSEINYIVSGAEQWLIYKSIDGLFTDISANAVAPLLSKFMINDKGEFLSKVESVRYFIASKPGDAKHFILKIYGLKSVKDAEVYIQNSQLSKAKEITLDSDSLNLDFTDEIAIGIATRNKNKVK